MSTRNTYYCFLLLLLVLPACKNENTDKNSLADNEVVETPVNENKAAPMYVAALSGMNMRATPDIKGEILKLVQYNDKVEVLEKTGIGLEVEGIQGEWYKVKDYEKEGYVFSGFLLDFEPPTGTPSVGFENYLSKYFKESEPKQAYSVKYKDGTSEKVVTPIPLEKVQVNEEMDWFEIIEKYEGGRTYTEVIGYESSTKKIFIPNISMREGFLLMKGILPYFLIAEDQCGLELKKVPFSKKNYTIKIDESCIFNIEIGKVGNEVTSITISNDDYYYSGLSVIKVNGGLEISRFYAL